MTMFSPPCHTVSHPTRPIHHRLAILDFCEQCKDAGVEAKGGREEMLGALAKARASSEGQSLLTEKGGGGGGGGGGSTNRGISRDSLPENLHAMSLPQLRAVCAAHGLKPQGNSVDEIIRGLEARAIIYIYMYIRQYMCIIPPLGSLLRPSPDLLPRPPCCCTLPSFRPINLLKMQAKIYSGDEPLLLE